MIAADDLLASDRSGEIVQDLGYHDARAFNASLSVTDFRIDAETFKELFGRYDNLREE